MNKNLDLSFYFEYDCLGELVRRDYDRSHFFDLKFISINIFSTELFGLYSLKSFEGISSLSNSMIPPPKLFLSSQNGELKNSIANWLERKKRSPFVSEITKLCNLS